MKERGGEGGLFASRFRVAVILVHHRAQEQEAVASGIGFALYSPKNTACEAVMRGFRPKHGNDLEGPNNNVVKSCATMQISLRGCKKHPLDAMTSVSPGFSRVLLLLFPLKSSSNTQKSRSA